MAASSNSNSNGKSFNSQAGLLTVGRYEQIATISLPNTNAAYQLPTNGGTLPNDRFIWSLRIEFQGRLTNPASGGPTGILADAPYSLIESIQVSGYHRIRAAKEQFINVRGSDLRELMKIYQAHNPYSLPASLSTTASATNDIDFIIEVPFVPWNMKLSQQAQWMLDAPNYDQLQLTIQFADANSVFSGQTTQPTLSAYGSSSGNAQIIVSGEFVMAGSGRLAGYVPGRLWRYWQEVTSGDIVSGNNNSRQFNIPRGNVIRGFLLKTGVKSTATSPGNNAYTSRSNTVYTNIQVMRGLNKPVRNYPNFQQIQQDIASAYGFGLSDTGYALVDFAQQSNQSEMLDLRGAVAGPTGDIDTFLQANVAGAANQAALCMYEELRGGATVVK